MLRLVTAVMIMLLAPVVLGESHWSNWSDKTLCRLSEDPELIEYRKAAKDRGLSCSADKLTSPGTAVAKNNIEGLIINNFRCANISVFRLSSNYKFSILTYKTN